MAFTEGLAERIETTEIADELLKGRFVQVTDAPDYAYHAALAEENTTMQESETGGTDYFGIIGNGMQREDLPATIQNLFSINLEESEKIEVEDIKNKSIPYYHSAHTPTEVKTNHE